MSLFGNISMLNTAMRNYQDGLNVSASNVSNVLTPGYTRQRLSLSSLPPLTDGYMQYGTGAMTTGIERLRNNFLDTQMKLQLSNLGKSEARETALNDLKAIFPELAAVTVPPSPAVPGIQAALTDLATQWQALSAAPGNAANQTLVRDALDTLANRLNVDARLLNDLETNLDLDVNNTILQINSLVDQIALLNKQIMLATAAGQGQMPNTLVDAREKAAQDLSRLVGGSYYVTADGSMSVNTNAGILVDHSQTFHLKGIGSFTDPGRTGVGYFDNRTNVYVDVTKKITGGKLAGLIQVRDVDAEDARLALDKIAFGMIQKTNEINKTAVAVDFTTNHAIYTGTKASDIALNPLLRTNLTWIGDTRDVPGDTAKIQANLQKINMYAGLQSSPFTPIQFGASVISPTATIGALRLAGSFLTSPGAAPVGAPGLFHITEIATGNGVNIVWDDNSTINSIVDDINTQGGGAIQATYDQTTYKLYIYSQAPVTAFDETANFLKAMALSAVVFSSAPINNAPISGINKAVSAQALNSLTNSTNLFTQVVPPIVPAANYITKFDNTNVTWQPVTTIGAVLLNITTSTPVGNKIYQSFNSQQQVVTLVKSGDQGFNAGILSAANPMNSISISDQTGNLSRVFNFDTNENSSRIFSEMTTAISSRTASEQVLVDQAEALVDNTQALQDRNAAVDLNEELANAHLFQRSYEASVRLQAIIDDMLNVLINHMGSSSMGSSSSI